MKPITLPPLWHTDSAFTTLAVENGQVDMTAVTAAYNQLLDSIRQHYYGLAATDKQFVFANVELIPTGLKTSEVTLKVTSGMGEASSVSPANFGPGDDWRWGWDQGKCDGTNLGLDAIDQLEYKIRLVMPAPASGYFTGIVTVGYAAGLDYSNTNYNPPTDPHQFLMYDGWYYNDCIEWQDMNFYLAGTKTVLQMNCPPAKMLISFEIEEDIVVGSPHYFHSLHDMRFGTPVIRPEIRKTCNYSD